MQLQLDNLFHSYGSQAVLRGLNLQLESGEIGCLLGPSGCGKTTALRCVAGFESLDSGEIKVGGVSLSRKGFTEPPERRQIGMVFQEAALLPHLTASDNVAFGLQGLPVAERRARAEENLAMVGLAGVGEHYPHELSGGQQQRVALARALAPHPRLILLDEPFANLDVSLRQRLGREVRDILKSAGVTTLLVTHDQYEAFMLADTIGVMRNGVIAQWGTPHEIYHHPVNRDVAAFVGRGVFLEGVVRSADTVEVAGVVVHGEVAAQHHAGDTVDILLRPDDVIEDAEGQVATVKRRAFRGATIVYTLSLHNGEAVYASLSAETDYPEGASLRVRIAPAHLVLFGGGAV
ncbi:MAG: ABC transporter ATP-binding protein [Gammaproteobacteria bacterium]|nr:ABC transporter ATP-binding protein [Gammaproteobacteria bacterium]